jgi:hypothetical protein
MRLLAVTLGPNYQQVLGPRDSRIEADQQAEHDGSD